MWLSRLEVRMEILTQHEITACRHVTGRRSESRARNWKSHVILLDFDPSIGNLESSKGHNVLYACKHRILSCIDLEKHPATYCTPSLPHDSPPETIRGSRYSLPKIPRLDLPCSQQPKLMHKREQRYGFKSEDRLLLHAIRVCHECVLCIKICKRQVWSTGMVANWRDGEVRESDEVNWYIGEMHMDCRTLKETLA